MNQLILSSEDRSREVTLITDLTNENDGDFTVCEVRGVTEDLIEKGFDIKLDTYNMHKILEIAKKFNMRLERHYHHPSKERRNVFIIRNPKAIGGGDIKFPTDGTFITSLDDANVDILIIDSELQDVSQVELTSGDNIWLSGSYRFGFHPIPDSTLVFVRAATGSKAMVVDYTTGDVLSSIELSGMFDIGVMPSGDLVIVTRQNGVENRLRVYDQTLTNEKLNVTFDDISGIGGSESTPSIDNLYCYEKHIVIARGDSYILSYNVESESQSFFINDFSFMGDETYYSWIASPGYLYLHGSTFSATDEFDSVYKIDIETGNMNVLEVPQTESEGYAFESFVADFEGNLYYKGAGLNDHIYRLNVDGSRDKLVDYADISIFGTSDLFCFHSVANANGDILMKMTDGSWTDYGFLLLKPDGSFITREVPYGNDDFKDFAPTPIHTWGQ